MGFESRHGEGAVELDALEALYPGELQAVLSRYIECYYDSSLSEWVAQVQARLHEDLSFVWQQVLTPYTDEVQEFQSVYEQLQEELAERLAGYSQRMHHLWHAMRADLRYYPLPLPEYPDEIGEGLYNSVRDYLEQVEAYKAFQGKLQVEAE